MKITELAHLLVRAHLLAQPSAQSQRCIAIDATVGNGYDTIFLAECVGAEGIVYGFDIHDMAVAHIEAGRQGLAERITFIQAGHETMLAHISPQALGGVQAIMFNLGYLPRGDKHITTTIATTIPALEQSLALLADGGILTIACYPGHPGGREETEAVFSFVNALPTEQYRVLHSRYVNHQRGAPPELITVYKLGNRSVRRPSRVPKHG